jgi:hypothetical protein
MNNAAEHDMPVISKFYGITIRMMRARDFGARFHAIYGNSELVVKLWPLDIICGDAPRRVKQLVLEWATLHQQELLSTWQNLQWGGAPRLIEPLQ